MQTASQSVRNARISWGRGRNNPCREWAHCTCWGAQEGRLAESHKHRVSALPPTFGSAPPPTFGSVPFPSGLDEVRVAAVEAFVAPWALGWPCSCGGTAQDHLHGCRDPVVPTPSTATTSLANCPGRARSGGMEEGSSVLFAIQRKNLASLCPGFSISRSHCAHHALPRHAGLMQPPLQQKKAPWAIAGTMGAARAAIKK